jgi:hypothetical protein
MNFKLEFTSNEVNILLASLSKMPYDQVAQLIEKLIADVKKQAETNTEKGEVKNA